jgi:hypothetical protein
VNPWSIHLNSPSPGQAQLDFVRGKVQAGAQPWKAAYDQMMASSYSRSRTPKPRAVVECGSYSNPNYGCTDEPKLTEAQRPAGSNNLFVAWETLTHGDNLS